MKTIKAKQIMKIILVGDLIQAEIFKHNLTKLTNSQLIELIDKFNYTINVIQGVLDENNGGENV